MLASYQATVDAAGTYADQVRAAEREFMRRNRASNPAFRTVRTQLGRMCASPGRCAWCEDSEAGEIDHIRPKSFYPEQTFSWPNFLRVCGACNRFKGPAFAVLDDGELVHIARGQGDPVTPPPAGRPALIDPRAEDPLSLLELDIAGRTFLFQPRFGLAGNENARAGYTIRLLRLNRDLLTAARATVYNDLLARLARFRERRDGGATEAEQERLARGVVEHPHPTVWREMQRQPASCPELENLFRDVPEARGWHSSVY